MIELDKKAIGERTKEEAIRVYGKINALPKAIGMGYQTFHTTYIKGKSLPGAKILAKYHQEGLNIIYILFGDQLEFKVSENSTEYSSLQEQNNKLKNKVAELENKLKQISKISI